MKVTLLMKFPACDRILSSLKRWAGAYYCSDLGEFLDQYDDLWLTVGYILG